MRSVYQLLNAVVTLVHEVVAGIGGSYGLRSRLSGVWVFKLKRGPESGFSVRIQALMR
jgi:hypothetical protein